MDWGTDWQTKAIPIIPSPLRGGGLIKMKRGFIYNIVTCEVKDAHRKLKRICTCSLLLHVVYYYTTIYFFMLRYVRIDKRWQYFFNKRSHNIPNFFKFIKLERCVFHLKSFMQIILRFMRTYQKKWHFALHHDYWNSVLVTYLTHYKLIKPQQSGC